MTKNKKCEAPGIATCNSGQALLETALVLPVLLAIILNAVNFGYFFLVALNLEAAPRSGVEYSILGFATPASSALPSGASVSSLAHADMAGALYSPASTPIQVCSETACATAPCLNNFGTATQTAKCQTFGNTATFPSPDSDPESPAFVLHRVDVVYTFSPLIPGTPFGIALLPASVCSSSGGTITCTFHRQVSMRAMN